MKKDLRFLVVDDFSTMRRIIKNLLHDLGYANVQEADDGKTALPMLQAEPFDVLITDWDMPGMPGLDLLKAVRSDPKLAKAGVNGYVIKPFTAQVLAEKLEKILAPA